MKRKPFSSQYRLVVKVFYRDDCKRCKTIFAKFKQILPLLPNDVKIATFDLNTRIGKNLACKYGIRRIPAVVMYDSIYFVGVPENEDLARMINYVYDHPSHAFKDELSK